MASTSHQGVEAVHQQPASPPCPASAGHVELDPRAVSHAKINSTSRGMCRSSVDASRLQHLEHGKEKQLKLESKKTSKKCPTGKDSHAMSLSEPALLFCGLCEEMHEPCDCPDSKPNLIVVDNCQEVLNCAVKAVSSLPTQLCLSVCTESRKHGLSVFVKENLPEGTQFGPLEGRQLNFNDLDPQSDLTHIWYAFKGRSLVDLVFFSTVDEETSNWCRYLRVSPGLRECNVVSVSQSQSLYFISRRRLSVGEELVVYCPAFREVLSHSLYVAGGEGQRTNGDSHRQTDTLHCSRCQLRFTNPINYVKHVQIFHPCGMLKLKSYCKVCSEEFLSLQDLSAHARAEHQGEGAFVCGDCGKNFICRNRLKSHMNVVHHVVGEYKCDECGKMYGSKWKLKDHKRNKHSKESFTCSKCNKLFKCKPAYVRHKRTHEQTYSFCCDRCGKKFRDGNNLKVHMLSHSGVKPFPCQVSDCSAAYTTKKSLQLHYGRGHGYREEDMPCIQRVVPFTLEAHVTADLSLQMEHE